jgi:tRNA modification GTPase
VSDTIFALSSGQGKAGVAVIRVSGRDAAAALQALRPGKLPPPRMARLARLYDPASGLALDSALILWFPGSASFTGEPSVEFHVHGGRAVVSGLLAALARLPDTRLAEPGEFTRRALENGKLDLTQVEALNDLINADTVVQRQQALVGLGGALAARVRQWRASILTIKMLISADIDFSDEGDVGDHAAGGIDSLMKQLEWDMADVLSRASRGKIVADGFKVAIVGKPNVGKSTLLNALAESDVAIVSDHAGTTRDVLEVNLDIGGYLVRLFDTAGLRATTDPVEAIGIGRAVAAMDQADIVLGLDDGLAGLPSDVSGRRNLIRVRTKSDLGYPAKEAFELNVSCKTGDGMEALKDRIAAAVGAALGDAESGIVTRVRQETALKRALEAITAARNDAALGVEIIAHHMQGVDMALANLIGEIGVEEVLGAVFSRFCVGK